VQLRKDNPETHVTLGIIYRMKIIKKHGLYYMYKYITLIKLLINN